MNFVNKKHKNGDISLEDYRTWETNTKSKIHKKELTNEMPDII